MLGRNIEDWAGHGGDLCLVAVAAEAVRARVGSFGGPRCRGREEEGIKEWQATSVRRKSRVQVVRGVVSIEEKT